MQIINGQIFLEECRDYVGRHYGADVCLRRNRIAPIFGVLAAFRKYYDDFRFFYAIKANNNLAVANILPRGWH